MPKVALVETKPSRTNFKKEFDDEFEFDQFQLCSDPGIKKVLKRDCDIDMNPDEYDWIILVGSDALKYYTPINSVTEYSGKKIEEKFLQNIVTSGEAAMQAINEKKFGKLFYHLGQHILHQDILNIHLIFFYLDQIELYFYIPYL